MKYLYCIYLLNAVLFSLVVFDVFSVPNWLFIFIVIWLGVAGIMIIKGE